MHFIYVTDCNASLRNTGFFFFNAILHFDSSYQYGQAQTTLSKESQRKKPLVWIFNSIYKATVGMETEGYTWYSCQWLLGGELWVGEMELAAVVLAFSVHVLFVSKNWEHCDKI